MDKYLGYSDLIIDKDCNDNMCSWMASLPVSAPTIDNFSSSPNNYLYAIGIYACILIIILFGLKKIIDEEILKKYKRTLQFIYKFTALSVIIQVIIAIFLDMTEDYSICYYEPLCFIINNTLHSSKIWYRLKNKECPDDIFGIFDIFQDYYGNFGNPNTMESSCSESEYGCCHYNNQCSFAMGAPPTSRNYISRLSLYNEYITNNNGYTYSQVWKEDDNGSNCLSIEDIIIKNVYGNDNKHYTHTIYLIIVYFIGVIIICIYGIFENKGKPRVQFVDLETLPNLGNSDEENDSFTDPFSSETGYQLSTRQQQEREEFLKSDSHRTGRSKGSPPTQQNLKASC